MTEDRRKLPLAPAEAGGGAEMELSRERAFLGKLKRAMEGKNPGFKPPYGYRLYAGVGVFALEPAEAELVRRIYRLYSSGSGTLAITHRLNEEGVSFRAGRPWSVSTVKKILENPIYCGDLQYGRRSRNPDRGSGEPFYLCQDPQVLLRDAVPAVLPREEWDAVQAIRASRPAVGKGGSGRAFSSRHLLSGVARCVCGCTIIGYRGRGQTEYYYRCSGQRRKGKQACECGYLRQEEVDVLVLRRLEQDLEARRGLGSETARRLQGLRDLPAAERKQLLRDMVECIRIFRKQGTQELVCEIQWKER
ncbi:MAG: recombinase family protein [Chloroflexota bacterium]